MANLLNITGFDILGWNKTEDEQKAAAKSMNTLWMKPWGKEN
jgi:hypothetical protein